MILILYYLRLRLRRESTEPYVYSLRLWTAIGLQETLQTPTESEAKQCVLANFVVKIKTLQVISKVFVCNRLTTVLQCRLLERCVRARVTGTRGNLDSISNG
jgi:hypothetical protein